MGKYTILSVLLGFGLRVYAQTDSATGVDLDEAIVYANKFVEKKKNLAQKIDIITVRLIATFNSQNSGDLLLKTGNVFVQKSQQGGSSPVIRGFEASRVLIIIDGVRMNNAVYRAGHLQNVITIDQNMLERVEVLYGPASTIYGSDALGGVIHFRSKTPLVSGNSKTKTQGASMVRYCSANHEKTVHADLNVGWKKIAWLQSYTFSDFADMKMGTHDHDRYPGFGKRLRYISSINGIDSLVGNPDSRIQKFSGYKQWDILQKFLFKPSNQLTHQINLQYSNSGNIPRYDRLQDTRDFGGNIGTTLRYAEWFYGPQTRILGAYELSAFLKGFIQELKFNINYQDIKESRQQREYRRYDRFDSRREHIMVGGFTMDGRKTWGQHELNMGFDGQFNKVRSVADRTDLHTGIKTKLDARYPDGKNRMNYFGFYAQHLLKIKNGKLVLNDGIRFQFVQLRSTINDNSFFNLPVTDMRQDPFAVTGNLGLIYMPKTSARYTINLSSGFRAPNIDDLARIFESSTAARRLIIPNSSIKPEYTYNVDAGITRIIANNIHLEISGFYTFFRNAINTAPYSLQGEDSILYNGIMSAVYASQNINKARLSGFNLRIKANLGTGFSWDNTINHTEGRLRNKEGENKPMDHIPPLFGKSSLHYTSASKKSSFEFYTLFNGWKKLKNYNPDGEDNGQYATADGMPSWFTLNCRASYTIQKKINLQAGIENILDRNYRYFASGISAAGRNLIIALRVGF